MAAPLQRSAEELGQRAALFRLLAQLFLREVDASLLGRLAAGGFLDDLIEEPAIRQTLGDPTSALIDELAIAYTAILIGPGAHVSPYGSVHHPGDPQRGRLWGDTTLWLRRFTRDHGLAFEGPGYHGIPDHVGIELELIARLLARTGELAEAGEPARVEALIGSLAVLFEQHTLPWLRPFSEQVVRFAERVESPAGRALYQGLARLAADLVEDEGRALGVDP